MDALAALEFGGEPPSASYLDSKPMARSGALISVSMWSAIATGGLWLFVVSAWFLTSASVRAAFDSREAHLTAYFCYFILSTQANAWNCRTKRANLLQGLSENRQFVLIFSLVLVVQVAMTEWGGQWLRTVPLSVGDWLFVALLAATVIPIDLARKALLLPWLRRRLSPSAKARLEALTAYRPDEDEASSEEKPVAIPIRS
jgi:hypothetical protein